MTNGQPTYLDRSALAREFDLFPHLKRRAEQSAPHNRTYELHASRAAIWRGIILVLLLFWSLFAYGVYKLI
jgi:hypothetical protein